MLEPKFQHFGYVLQTANSMEKTHAGKDWRQEEKRAMEDVVVECIIDSLDMSLSKLQEIVKDREVCCAVVHGFAKSWTGLSNWTTATILKLESG